MLMNLTDVFLTEGKVVQTKAAIDFDTVKVFGDEYQLCEAEPLEVKLQNEGKGKVSVHIKTSFSLLLSCDRCLKKIHYPMLIDVTEFVSSPDMIDSFDDEQDENPFMEGYQLDVDNLLISNIVLNWPVKILCREDCKGICKICGKDLNTGTCECDTFVPSPGLAGIKEIFNANKEV